ncbi:MAG: hypothetical protein ACKOUS_09700, partial [Alphaproteobacteria bacterium]
MQLFPRLRLVPDGTQIQFMKGRYAGLIFSALLSALSVVLYFAPGLNYGIDFKGGIVIEARAPAGLREGAPAQVPSMARIPGAAVRCRDPRRAAAGARPG